MSISQSSNASTSTPNANSTLNGSSQLTIDGSGGPYFVISDSGQPPAGSIAFNSNNRYAAPAPVCFAAGTLIATTRGEIAVEALRVGDVVVTAGGRERPIRWLGGTRVHRHACPRPADLAPVVFAPGSLAAGVPNRALTVSPGHRMLIDGMLFQAESLVNDLTIARATCAVIDYHHVELDEPDALIANGAAAESFVDVGNRAGFNDAIGLPGAMPVLDADPLTETFAPNIKTGPELAAVRTGLLERALTMGWSRAVDRRIAIGIAGTRIEPAASVGDRHWFILPEAAAEIVLLSAAATCSAVKPDLDDHRRLGVQVLGIVADGREAPLHSPAFADGFHACEDADDCLFRWTDGAATLRLKRAVRVLEIRIGRGAEIIVADARDTLALAS